MITTLTLLDNILTAKTVHFKRLLLQTVSFSVNEQVSFKRVPFE